MPGYFLQPFHSAPQVPFNFDGRILFHSEKYELIHLTLQPGEGMEPHTQPMEVLFYILEGEGTLMIDDEPLHLTATTTVHLKAGIKRCWTNTGQIPLKLLVNKIL